MVDGQRAGPVAAPAPPGGPASGPVRHRYVQGVAQQVEVLVDHEAVGPEDLLLRRG